MTERKQTTIAHVLFATAVAAVCFGLAQLLPKPALGFVGLARNALHMFAIATLATTCCRSLGLASPLSVLLASVCGVTTYLLGWQVVNWMHSDDFFWKGDEIPLWDAAFVAFVVFLGLCSLAEAGMRVFDRLLNRSRVNNPPSDK